MGVDGWQVKACAIESLPFGSGATPIELQSESIAKTNTLLNTQGFYGTRSKHKERSRIGPTSVGGQLSFEMSPAVMVFFWPMILGADASGTTFALAEAMQSFQLQIDRVTKVYNYTGMVVNKATLKGSSGGFVNVTLDLIGEDEEVADAGTGQSLTVPIDPPFIFEDAVVTIGGTAYNVFDFELSVDNKMSARMVNSLTAESIRPQDLREVMFNISTPYGATEHALYSPGITSAAATLVITNGNYSTTLTMPALQAPTQSPVTPGKGEVPLRLNYQAMMTSTTKEVVITHDSTP